MWSVWSEKAYLYLGSGLALLRLPGQALVRFEHPATLPLPDVLHELNALSKASEGSGASSKRHWRVSVCLSAVLCPPVFFSMPTGIKRWSECEAVANSHGAKAWGLQPAESSEVVCAMDRAQAGISAAMLQGVAHQLVIWAKKRPGGATLQSISPLWAIATQTAVSRAKSTLGLSLLELDGLTCLDFRPDAKHRAMVWARPQFETNLQGLWDQETAWWRSGESIDVRQDLVQVVGAPAQGNGLVRLGFATRDGEALEGGALGRSRGFGGGSFSAWADMWEQMS